MKLKKKWQWLAAFVGVGILLAMFYRALSRPEPVYEKQPLSFWFNESARLPYVYENAVPTQAIRCMGKACVPYLTRQLRHEDSKLDEMYRKEYPKLPSWLKTRLSKPFPPRARQQTAAMLLSELGESAQSAYPDMLAVYDRKYLKEQNLPASMVVDWFVQLTNPPAPIPSTGTNPYLVDSSSFWLLRGFTTIGGAHKETVPLLLAALHDYPEFRFTASNWITISTNLNLSAQLAKPSLISALRDSDPTVRTVAAFVLGNLVTDHPEVIEPLMKTAADDPVASVRTCALKSLLRAPVNLETSLPFFAKIADDPEPFNRGQGVWRLMRASGGRAKLLAALNEQLGNQDPAVRAAAAKLLGYFGANSKLAVPKLTDLTRESNEPDAKVREQAAAALAKIESPEVRK